MSFDEVHALAANIENLTFIGTASANTGYGNSLVNVITCNSAADTLWGYGGDDTLAGGLDHDILWGGDGTDVFSFASGDGNDVIADFADGADHIKLAGRTWGEVQLASTADGVLVSFKNSTDTILLQCRSLAAISQADFMFV